MNIFGPKNSKNKQADNILSDLPRGEAGRSKAENFLPNTYFEDPGALAKLGFTERSADTFLGITQGVTERIRRPDGRAEYRTTDGAPVGLRDDRHLTTIAGNRSGKGRSVIIPNLLTYGGSMLVIDPKGENASITARYRAKILGQKVVIIDPFKICRGESTKWRGGFNPMKILTPESPTLVEDAGLISDAAIMMAGGDTHWDESAKQIVESVLLHVATSYEYGAKEKNLVTVGDLISGRRGTWSELMDGMMANSALDNLIAGAALSFKEMPERELGSILSTVRKNLRFLQYGAMRDVLSDHDCDLEDLKDGNLTIFLVLPATRLGTCARWLRMFINLTIAAMEHATVKPKIPVLMVLDEFAVLGHLQELENAIGQMAGMGLRVWSILQDLNQLKALYKDRAESFLGNSGMIQFFGQADFYTSNWISNYLGKTTLTVMDAGNATADARNSHGATGFNERQQVHELMTPEEVRQYFARDDHFNRQLVLIPGRRPYILQRANYDQHSMFAGRFDTWM